MGDEHIHAGTARLGMVVADAAHGPAMRHAAEARRELGIRTVFNVLGPLANPARVRQAHAAGQQVYAWTVNSPRALQYLAYIGVDGVITDRLDLAVGVGAAAVR